MIASDRRLPGWALIATALLGLACAPPAGDGGTAGDNGPSVAETLAEPIFAERAAELGLDFVHTQGDSGRYYPPEIMGSGVALFDYDGDGDLDLYLAQGRSLLSLPGESSAEGDVPRDRLYRNRLAETGSLALTDVTAAAGLDARGYGMGAAVGDYDGDGDPDLYVTNFGPNQLWRNEGDGTFREVTAPAGAGDDRWSTSATFFDYDGDGWLDLFVGNYMAFSAAAHKDCYAESSALDYCGPRAYDPLPDRLLRNRGDGTFEDVSAVARISTELAATLGVVAADFDGDGRQDLYVANDAYANRLLVNQGDGTFRDEALLAGCAYNSEGLAEGSMGVDAGDYDGDGLDDLFMTHIREETNTLYRNLGAGLFDDTTFPSGLGVPSRGATGFGTGWIDYDNDGRLDLLVANGAVRLDPEHTATDGLAPYRQPDQLFRNLGDGRFADLSQSGGPAFTRSEVGRGAAFGDLDRDGDVDAVVSNVAGRPFLLINQVGQRQRWLGLRLVTSSYLGGPRRDAYGARAGLRLSDGRVLWRRVRPDGSYASASDPWLLYGLGADGEPVELIVRWASGREESWSAESLPPVGAYHELDEGAGHFVALPAEAE